MARSNDSFRGDVLSAVPATDGIPDYLLRTVRMLRAAFPTGLAVDSPDYTALWLFLEQEGCSPNAIATALHFAFHFGYVEARNARGRVRTVEERDREIARAEELLRPHGLGTMAGGGKLARTPRAKQCRWCRHDWH